MSDSVFAAAADEAHAILARLGVPDSILHAGDLPVRSPVTGEALARLAQTPDVPAAIGRAHDAFLAWRQVPAPRRGELVRLLGEELRAAKADL
ncbi:MAG: aldehyde dehydrogenase family protein, partial [Rhizobiales bacterium 32-66-8]